MKNCDHDIHKAALEQPDLPAQTELRNQLDQIDRTMMELLMKRMSLSASMAAAKKNTLRPLFDQTREQDILRKMPGCCCHTPLEQQSRFCTAGIRVYEEILRQSRRIQARELLPSVIVLIGSPRSEIQRAQVGETLSQLLGFSFFDTKKEWPSQLPQNEMKELFSHLLLQKEWIVCCGDPLLSHDSICHQLHESDSCIFVDTFPGDKEEGRKYQNIASHSLIVQDETPQQAAEKITALLRT